MLSQMKNTRIIFSQHSRRVLLALQGVVLCASKFRAHSRAASALRRGREELIELHGKCVSTARSLPYSTLNNATRGRI